MFTYTNTFYIFKSRQNCKVVLVRLRNLGVQVDNEVKPFIVGILNLKCNVLLEFEI